MRLYPAPPFETTQRGVHALPSASDLMRDLLLAQAQLDGAVVTPGLAEQDLGNTAWQVQEDPVGRRLGEPPEAGRDLTHQCLRRGGHARADVVDRFARDEEELGCLQGLGVRGPGATVGDTELAENAARLDDREGQLAAVRGANHDLDPA